MNKSGEYKICNKIEKETSYNITSNKKLKKTIKKK